MATLAGAENASFAFDDRNIRWYQLGNFDHFVFAMLDVDRQKRIIDFIIKFAANQRIVLHRHLALTNTLVVQGEHRLYEPNGKLKEIRPVGGYTSSPPGEPHSEGGGDEGAVVFYSIRGEQDTIFELFDDKLNFTGTLTMQDFLEALAQQKAS